MSPGFFNKGLDQVRENGPRFIALACLLLLAWAPVARAQFPVLATNLLRPDFWDTDGAVHAIVATNGVVYVGGAFSYVAPRERKVAAIDAYTAEPIPEFPNIAGAGVFSMVSDENGGWYLGGEFTSVGGLARTNLVHLRSDFSVNPDFQPNPNGAVRTLVFAGGTLYVGGSFTTVGGQFRNRLAALNPLNGQVTPWAPNGFNDYVSAMQVSGDTIYVGGRFPGYLRAIDQAGATLPWNPQLDGEVLALGLMEDRVIAGGNFNVVGGETRNGLAALDRSTGNVVPNWDPNPRDGLSAGGKVTSLRVVCATVYVGGYFTTIGGANRSRVAAVDGYSGLATAWDAGLGLFRSGVLPSFVQTLEVSGNTVFVGGEFNTANGQTRHDLIAVDSDSGQVLAWNPSVDGGISALGVTGRTLLAAFTSGPGGVERHNLAAFDEFTGRALDWNPDADNAVFALAFSGNTLFAGGIFSSVGGEPRERLAALDATTGAVLTNWVANANSNVLALAANEGRLFVGGEFTQVNGTTRRSLAAIEASTGQLIVTWSNFVDRAVHALAVNDSTVYVGGSFRQVALSTRNRLAALDAHTGSLLTWNPNVSNSPVRSLLVVNGTVYAGGQFLAVGGQPRAGVAAIDGVSGQVLPWNPGTQLFDLEPDVRALAVSWPIIYLGGSSFNLAGQTRLGLGAVHADGSVLSWNPRTSDQNAINALAVSAPGVYAGAGNPVAFQDAPSRRHLGMFPRIGAPRLLKRPLDLRINQGGTATFSVEAAGSGMLNYQWRLNGVALGGETNATLIRTNLQSTHGGIYDVQVWNTLGVATAEASLIVLAPVQILVQPQPQSVEPGSTVVLSVTAAGSPSPIYHWRLNGVLIPGAVYPTLILTNVTPQSGGRYSVDVANSSGTVASDIVEVTVQTTTLALSDSFAGANALSGASGMIAGSNVGGTREDASGEPRHAGKGGGASVWVNWIAPASGIATFSTRGSGFDTLLGVYTNATLARLGEVTSDEDRGAFLTSRASFNARAGVEYRIAIDGVGGASGNLVLAWETELGTSELPVVAVSPAGQTVPLGGTASFSATVVSSLPVGFQWYFGCEAIRGATNAVLTLTNILSRQAGFYHVLVSNPQGRAVESLPAVLEIGPFLAGRSFEKLEDLQEGLPPAGGGPGLAPAMSVSPFLVSLGTVLSHTFNTSTNSRAIITNDCGIISGSAAYLAFQPLEDGVVMIDTVGSSIDTVLSVFNYGFVLTDADRIACDDNSVDGRLSRVRFNASSTRAYLARVSGAGSSRGQAQINWRLGVPPKVALSNDHVVAGAGLAVSLNSGVETANTSPTSYQWQFNGLNLTGATNASLDLANLTSGMTGTYSVIVSNFAGMVTNIRAYVQVKMLTLENLAWTGDGRFRFDIAGAPGASFVIEVGSNPADPGSWTILSSGTIPENAGPVAFTDPGSPADLRFYRVRPPRAGESVGTSSP